jgi:hypothetical protein
MHWLVESAEEKEAKRLLSIGTRGPIRIGPRVPMRKSFLFLFFKKEILPCLIL